VGIGFRHTAGESEIGRNNQGGLKDAPRDEVGDLMLGWDTLGLEHVVNRALHRKAIMSPIKPGRFGFVFAGANQYLEFDCRIGLDHGIKTMLPVEQSQPSVSRHSGESHLSAGRPFLAPHLHREGRCVERANRALPLVPAFENNPSRQLGRDGDQTIDDKSRKRLLIGPCRLDQTRSRRYDWCLNGLRFQHLDPRCVKSSALVSGAFRLRDGGVASHQPSPSPPSPPEVIGVRAPTYRSSPRPAMPATAISSRSTRRAKVRTHKAIAAISAVVTPKAAIAISVTPQHPSAQAAPLLRATRHLRANYR